MNSKSENKLNFKEYIFLTICLLIFFGVAIYLMGYGTFPKGAELIITSIGVVVAIPVVIYMIKKIM